MWARQEESLTYCHADHHKGRRCFKGVHGDESPLRLIVPQKRCVFVHALTRLTVDQYKKNPNIFYQRWIWFQASRYFPGSCLLLGAWLKSNFLVACTKFPPTFFFFCCFFISSCQTWQLFKHPAGDVHTGWWLTFRKQYVSWHFKEMRKR